MSDFIANPKKLSGHHLHLEPLAPRHAPDLFLAGQEARSWQFLPRSEPFADLSDAENWVADALEMASTGWEQPWVAIAHDSGRAIGSLRFLDIRPEDRAMEIGWSWFPPELQGGPVELEAHGLLLRHAFENLETVRVQYLFDARNPRAQRLCERLGARREGLLRKHRVTSSGFSRDSLVYSLLDSEWPAVRQRLAQQLDRDATPA